MSATQTHMEYEVYRHDDATDAEFTEISDFFKNIMREDKNLCNGAQKNLNSGIFLHGELHPRVEKVGSRPPHNSARSDPSHRGRCSFKS